MYLAYKMPSARESLLFLTSTSLYPKLYKATELYTPFGHSLSSTSRSSHNLHLEPKSIESVGWSSSLLSFITIFFNKQIIFFRLIIRKAAWQFSDRKKNQYSQLKSCVLPVVPKDSNLKFCTNSNLMLPEIRLQPKYETHSPKGTIKLCLIQMSLTFKLFNLRKSLQSYPPLVKIKSLIELCPSKGL